MINTKLGNRRTADSKPLRTADHLVNDMNAFIKECNDRMANVVNAYNARIQNIHTHYQIRIITLFAAVIGTFTLGSAICYYF